MRKEIIKPIPDFVVYLCMLVLGALIVYMRMESYLKFIFLFVCFSAGFLYEIWIKKTLEDSFINSEDEQNRITRLMEKASQVDKISFNPNKAEEESKFLFSLFQEFMRAEKLIIWIRKDKEFKVAFAYQISKSLWSSLRINEKFVFRIKSLNSPQRLEEVFSEARTDKSSKIAKSFQSFLEKTGCNWILPLGYRGHLSGFILLTSPRVKLTNLEKRLTLLVCDLLGQGLKSKELEKEKEKTESQLKNRLAGDIRGESGSVQNLKKRLFDLYSLFQATEVIYNIKDKERLFFMFAGIIQKQMDSKWVVVFLPDEKSGDLVPQNSKGIELSSFHPVVIKKQSKFFSWVGKRADPFRIYDLERSLKKEKVTVSLLGLGIQLGCKLNLPGGNFGVVFSGEKTEGIRYDSTDLANFGILNNMATLTLKNIKQFKIIEELSYTDSMTGLYNYRYFYKRLSEEIFRAKRFGRKLSLVIFDIDEFKVYNDTYGHQAGDAVLRQLGKFILKVVRSMDVVSRYGGEEFCVIMPEADDKECIRFMERLRKSIKDYPFNDEYLGHEHHITVSLGGAIYPQDAVETDRLVYCADMALLRAKNTGRNQSVMFSSEKFVLKPTS